MTSRYAASFVAIVVLCSPGTMHGRFSAEHAVRAGACRGGVTGAGDPGYFAVTNIQGCDGAEPQGGAAANAVSDPATIAWVDCGPRVTGGVLARGSANPCELVAAICEGQKPSPGSPPTTTMAQIETRSDGTQRLVNWNCYAPIGGGAAQVTPLMAAQQAQRLVPGPAVGVAPPGGVSLVNIQTLLWVDTPVDRSLGTVTLLGQRVQLRVHVVRVGWDFGDGTSDVASSPGLPYSVADPCNTALCPGYYGHVYTVTGLMRITAQVSWTGEFRVGGGGWQPIAGTVTGPAQATTVTVRQARGVLVPDPVGPGGQDGS